MWRIDSSGVRDGRSYPATPLIEGDFREALLREGPDRHVIPPNSPPTSGNAWARQSLLRVLPMPEAPYRTGADNYLLNIIPAYGRIRAVPEPLGCYRSHGRNDSQRALAEYAEEFVLRHEVCRTALARHLSTQGLEVDSEAWPRNTWFHKIAAAIPEFARAVPEGAHVILVADYAKFMVGRRTVRFLERNGEYAGDPADSAEAHDELLCLWRSGADYFAIPSEKYWYWRFYPEFVAQLENFAIRILSSDSWRIFRLPARGTSFSGNSSEASTHEH
jgi:hypothetical protein